MHRFDEAAETLARRVMAYVLERSHRDPPPLDDAAELSRRARGLPFRFPLAVHGTAAYPAAIARTIAVACYAAAEIRRRDVKLLRDLDLSVVVFRRLGRTASDYRAWSGELLDARQAFVVPTTHEGEIVAGFDVVHPTTTPGDISAILNTMA